MAKQIKITDKEPSAVSKLIESNYKIQRVKFGQLTDNRFQIVEFFKRPIVLTISGVLIWFYLHITFLHDSFTFDTKSEASYVSQYIKFLLSNNLTFSFLLSFGGLFKHLVDLKINKARKETEI